MQLDIDPVLRALQVSRGVGGADAGVATGVAGLGRARGAAGGVTRGGGTTADAATATAEAGVDAGDSGVGTTALADQFGTAMVDVPTGALIIGAGSGAGNGAGGVGARITGTGAGAGAGAGAVLTGSAGWLKRSFSSMYPSITTSITAVASATNISPAWDFEASATGSGSPSNSGGNARDVRGGGATGGGDAAGGVVAGAAAAGGAVLPIG